MIFSKAVSPSNAETRHIVRVLTESSLSRDFSFEGTELMVDNLPNHFVDLHYANLR